MDLAADPRFAAVVAAFSGDRRVTSGRMMASLGLKVNGKIFAMLVRGDLVVKLPRERVTALVDAGLGQQFDPRRDGRLMKEWVVIAGDDPPWGTVAREALDFVGGATGKRR
ncbi:MAG TPA: TfoX/Sxy family protein [Myxococcaceae bacterium]|nr:TfoX/Sxy family protein [Myxococcaceae bacterium]